MRKHRRTGRLIHLQTVVVISAFIIASCGGSDALDDDDGRTAERVESTRRVESQTIEFPGELSREEARLIDEITRRGELVVAMRKKPGVYAPGVEPPAFQHRLVQKLASLLAFDVRVVVVDTIGEYFAATTATTATALPLDVDIYADIITILPTREAIVRFVPTIPVRQLLLFAAGSSIDSISDLKDLRFAMAKDSSYESMIKSIAGQSGFTPNYVHVSTTAEMLDAVAEGRADVTLQDSILGIEIVGMHETLVLGRPLGELQMLGWAVARENEALARFLIRFIHYVRETGVWEQYWRDDFGIGYLEYLELIGL